MVASRVRFCFISVSLLTPVVGKKMLRCLERLCLSDGRRSSVGGLGGEAANGAGVATALR